MKDEIKAILIQDSEPTPNNPVEIKRLLVNKEAEDYITNLQEKVNQYENPDDMTLMFMWCDEKAKDKIKQLQEENERLKEDMKIKDNTISINYNKDTKEYTLDRKNYYKINKRLNERLDYKSRNEKAIEFNQIVLNSDYVYSQDEIAQKNLNILQGEDKDE